LESYIILFDIGDLVCWDYGSYFSYWIFSGDWV